MRVGANTPPVPTLDEAVGRARAVLASSLNPSDLQAALEDLLSWVEKGLNPAERRAIVDSGLDPESYTVVTTALQSVGGAVGLNELHQQIVILNFQTYLRMDALRCSPVLGPNGVPPNPVEGAFPVIIGRWVVPKKIFKVEP